MPSSEKSCRLADWKKIRAISESDTHFPLWECVVLSYNLDPDSLTPDTLILEIILATGAFADYLPEQIDKNEFAHRLLISTRKFGSKETLINLRTFAAFATELGWDIPNEMDDIASDFAAASEPKRVSMSGSESQVAQKEKAVHGRAEAIVAALTRLGYKPKALPRYRPGKTWVKNPTRLELNLSTSAFDQAWEYARRWKMIKEISKENTV